VTKRLSGRQHSRCTLPLIEAAELMAQNSRYPISDSFLKLIKLPLYPPPAPLIGDLRLENFGDLQARILSNGMITKPDFAGDLYGRSTQAKSDIGHSVSMLHAALIARTSCKIEFSAALSSPGNGCKDPFHGQAG
jgi:hypothetical protein